MRKQDNQRSEHRSTIAKRAIAKMQREKKDRHIRAIVSLLKKIDCYYLEEFQGILESWVNRILGEDNKELSRVLEKIHPAFLEAIKRRIAGNGTAKSETVHGQDVDILTLLKQHENNGKSLKAIEIRRKLLSRALTAQEVVAYSAKKCRVSESPEVFADLVLGD